MSENTAEKQRLLIVDDSKVIRVTARKILQDHFETVEAVDGENAWEILNGMGPFSLVVSDLTMPKLDGYGLLKKIRTAHDPDISGIPVIVITGDNDSEEIMQRAREAGATDFIGKPFDAVHLLARAQSHASAWAEQQSLTGQNITLEEQALVDPQTGLPNEAAFMERGYQQLSYATRHNTTLTVVQLEIDNYGELSGKYGDPVTGMVTKYAATVLESGIRHEDMAARTGAARFAMLLTGMERNGVQALADRICKNINTRVIRYGSEQIHFTVSIGICSPDIQNDTRFDDLLAAAGKHLQQAIMQGGNRSILESTATSADDTVIEETLAENDPCPAVDKNISRTTSVHPSGTRPIATEESAADETVAVIDDESIAEILAGTVEQPVPDDKPGTAESTAEEKLPEMFAEPVTGISKKLANKVARERELASAGEQEEIVITAPFGTFVSNPDSDSQPEAELDDRPGSVQETIEDSGQAEQPDALPAAARSSATGHAVTPETTTPRQGLFRRMLSLFSRSGK